MYEVFGDDDEIYLNVTVGCRSGKNEGFISISPEEEPENMIDIALNDGVITISQESVYDGSKVLIGILSCCNEKDIVSFVWDYALEALLGDESFMVMGEYTLASSDTVSLTLKVYDEGEDDWIEKQVTTPFAALNWAVITNIVQVNL